jgi:RNA polymerase sigma-70 factor (ECF subfamily)
MAARAMTIPEHGAELQSILRRAASGSADAFSELYDSHYRYVLWVCRKYFWRAEDAEDAAAEIFLKLHRVLGSHDPSQAFRPWLAQVASRHCLDKLRRNERERRRRVDEEVMADLPDDATPSPLAQVLNDENRRRVQEELDRLPERHRVPLVLHYYNQMSYQEMARELGRSLPIVRMLLFQARKKLRNNLRRPDGETRISRAAGSKSPRRLFAPVAPEACGAD